MQCFHDYLNCAHHRHVVLCLSSMLHMIMLDCPAALVWNSLSSGTNQKAAVQVCGSPLDILPCPPSALPVAPGPSVERVGYRCAGVVKWASLCFITLFG